MKKILRNGVVGAMSGVTGGVLISLAFSAAFSSTYMPSTPRFMAHFSSSVSAMGASVLLWAMMGVLWGTSILIFRIDSWSMTRQTVVHFAICYVVYTLLAELAGWFPQTFVWLRYTILFIGIYVWIWLTQYLWAKAYVARINAKLGKR